MTTIGKGFFDQPRVGGKSIWDWVDLMAKLAIPLVVLIATISFGWWQGQLTDLQHQNDLKIANDQQQTATLKSYLDDMTDLMLNHGLRQSKLDDVVRIVARVKTLTALPEVNPDRKVALIKFLYEAGLIGSLQGNTFSRYPYIVGLSGADLSNVNLSGDFLSGAELSYVNLRRANLDHTILEGADLIGADLIGADLTGVDLQEADLTNAKVKPEQLAQAYSLQGAMMPNGSRHP